MNRQELIAQIRRKKSVLCVGLDTDIEKIPAHLLQEEDPVLAFNKAIIEATQDYAVAYKINTAFYEANGIQGWISMQKTLELIPADCFTIADAKRGDIGNTSDQYAKAFFKNLSFDSITVAPYMGYDSVAPFLQYEGKWAIVLGVTSNAGSKDFQLQTVGNKQLFEVVLETVKDYGTDENTMFVVGATRTDQLQQVRAIIPNHFLLIPGVGAQGGDLDEVMKNTLNQDAGILINVSRGIIFADKSVDFAKLAGEQATAYQKAMSVYL